jgi:hypothetical protein
MIEHLDWVEVVYRSWSEPIYNGWTCELRHRKTMMRCAKVSTNVVTQIDPDKNRTDPRNLTLSSENIGTDGSGLRLTPRSSPPVAGADGRARRVAATTLQGGICGEQLNNCYTKKKLRYKAKLDPKKQGSFVPNLKKKLKTNLN